MQAEESGEEEEKEEPSQDEEGKNFSQGGEEFIMGNEGSFAGGPAFKDTEEALPIKHAHFSPNKEDEELLNEFYEEPPKARRLWTHETPTTVN